jgi:hypothetical protein
MENYCIVLKKILGKLFIFLLMLFHLSCNDKNDRDICNNLVEVNKPMCILQSVMAICQIIPCQLLEKGHQMAIHILYQLMNMDTDIY